MSMRRGIEPGDTPADNGRPRFRIWRRRVMRRGSGSTPRQGGVLCGLLLLVGGWIGPSSVSAWLAVFFAPAVMALWAILPAARHVAALRWIPYAIKAHLWLAVAVALAGCSGLAYSVGLSVSDGLLGIFAILGDLLVLGTMPDSEPEEPARRYGRALLWSAGLSAIGTVACAIASIGLAVWRAEAVAAGRPYCILVGSERPGGRAASSLLDLRELSVTWSMAHLFRNRPVLAIESDPRPRRLTWSHARQSFEPQRVRGLKRRRRRGRPPEPPACELRAHFVRHLPLMPVGR